MKSLVYSLFLFVCSCGCFLTTGCTKRYFFGDPIIEVKDSGLNFLQIYYQASPKAPRIRCDMRDRGQIAIMEGHSATVGDDFNIDVSGTNLTDIRRYSYLMGPDDFKLALQTLVNAGLLVDESAPKDEAKCPPEKVLVKGRINGRKIEKFVFDPDLITEIQIQLYQYKRSGSY